MDTILTLFSFHAFKTVTHLFSPATQPLPSPPIAPKNGNKLNDAKLVARGIIRSLSQSDHVAVVCAKRSHVDYWVRVVSPSSLVPLHSINIFASVCHALQGNRRYQRTSVLSCQPHGLQPATTSNKEDIYSRLDGIVPAGGTDPETGLRVAHRLLNGQCNGIDACPSSINLAPISRSDCQQFVIFITDGKDKDPDVRCGSGYYSCNKNSCHWVPPPICRWGWSNTFKAASDLGNRAPSRRRTFSYLISTSREAEPTSDDGQELPGYVACANQGTFAYVPAGRDVVSTLQPYFDFLLATTITKQDVFWSAPYVDAFGLGVMVTVAVPVKNSAGSRLGVVGIDVTLDTIIRLLEEEEWGEVYSFLTTEDGSTVLHPQLRFPDDLKDDPVFPNLVYLEQQQSSGSRKPAEFSTVATNMKDGTQGSTLVQAARRVVLKGDRTAGVSVYEQKTTYHYRPIPDSQFRFGLAVADFDKNFRELQVDSVRTANTGLYHRLDQYLEKHGSNFDGIVLTEEVMYPEPMLEFFARKS